MNLAIQSKILDQYYKKKINLKDIIEKLAPGTPAFNEKTRSRNPIAYHKYTSGENYTFYIMEYILEDGYLWFWGYEVDKDLGNITLCSWYRTVGMMTITETMKRSPRFKPTPVLDIPEIGKEWVSTTHDTERDHLAGDYARKYFKAEANDQHELTKDLAIYYQYQGEKLDLQHQRQIHKN